jgi:hypothetical protein
MSGPLKHRVSNPDRPKLLNFSRTENRDKTHITVSLSATMKGG